MWEWVAGCLNGLMFGAWGLGSKGVGGVWGLGSKGVGGGWLADMQGGGVRCCVRVYV